MSRPLALSRRAREQARILARAFEAGAFDEFLALRRTAVVGRSMRDRLGDAALEAVEDFLGAEVEPSVFRAVRIAVGADESGLDRPPSYGPDTATAYLRWLLANDLDRARKRRESARKGHSTNGRPKKPAK